MKISVLTLFPEVFDSFFHLPITARAVDRGLAEIEIVDIKDYAPGSFRRIDDAPYGGGAGMVLRCGPVLDALDSVKTIGAETIALVPAGTPYTQKKARALSEKEHLILICGHYEGIDARIYNHVDELISVGDYVLSGGEIPALTVMDSILRLLGTIRRESIEDESYENGLLEYPQYTKPADFRGERVPEVLRSGNHEKIRRWRLLHSLLWTREHRPDLFAAHPLSEEEQRLLAEYDRRNASSCRGRDKKHQP